MSPKIEKLLQHNELKKVSKLPSHRINKIDFKPIFNLCQQLCNQTNWAGLSVNEIPLDVWKEFTGLNNYINAIFLRPNNKNPNRCTFTTDVLIINPGFSSDLRKGFFPHLEGCGSINFGETLFLIDRPMDFTVSGHMFTPDINCPQFRHVNSKSVYRDMTRHEVDHINGLTAIDTPGLIFDPFQPGTEQTQYVLESYCPYIYKTTDEFYQALRNEEANKTILVSNYVLETDTTHFRLLSTTGEFVSDFPTPASSPTSR